MSEVGIIVDFGSTFTKVAAIDLDEEVLIGRGPT
jgi:sugar (pentulose or hexulose) kinase